MVPNSAITDAPVKNLSYLSSDGRVDVEVTVDHGSDPLAVTEVLLEAAMAEPSVLADPPPKVLLHGLQGLAFELWAWTSAIHASLSLRSSLNYAIEQGLRERGIELAGAHPSAHPAAVLPPESGRRWSGPRLAAPAVVPARTVLVLSGAVDAIHETERVSRKLFTFSAGQSFGELSLLVQTCCAATRTSCASAACWRTPTWAIRCSGSASG